MTTFLIYHVGKYGSACVDVQRAETVLDAVCAHRRYFSGRVISVRKVGK